MIVAKKPRTKLEKNHIVDPNDIIVKITAISIIQQLRRYSKDFYLKYPNDIICIEKRKLGGIIVELYKDFYIIGFGINIVGKPEQSEIRKEGLSPCFVNEHIPENKKKPEGIHLHAFSFLSPHNYFFCSEWLPQLLPS